MRWRTWRLSGGAGADAPRVFHRLAGLGRCDGVRRQVASIATARGARGGEAFTLVELLVVVAIIALLVTILMPSLGRALALARRSVCLSHLRGAGNGMSLYAADFESWLPGPNTSGHELTVNYGNYDGQDVTAPTEPVQNMDWISPSMADALGLPAKRVDRLVAILNTALRCPANKEMYAREYTGGGAGSVDVEPGKIRYSSYSAALGFHVYREGHVGDRRDIQDTPVKTRVQVPDDYRPSLEEVGTAADKVFAMDGARYVNSPTTVTFNAFIRQIRGGNFMLYGPATPLTGDPFRLNNDRTLRPENLRFAYRHNGNINVVFFDGHCKTLGPVESLSTSLYFPKGSVVINASLTQDPNDTNGPLE